MNDDVGTEPATLQQELAAARDNLHQAWLALRRLREEVEMRSVVPLTGSERTEPTFGAEAEQIARGIIAIYERAQAADDEHAALKRLVDAIRRLEPTTDAGHLTTNAEFLAAEEIVTERELARRADRRD